MKPTEPMITCPNCKTPIKLTESLAAPLVEQTRLAFEQRLAEKDAEAQRLVAAERNRIETEAKQKALLTVGAELQQKNRDLQEAQELLKQRDQKLAEAQRAQAEMIREKRAIEDKARELDLTIEKTVQERLGSVRERAKLEMTEEFRLKLSEHEQRNTALQKQIEDLKRRAEQGSQQLQGEVQELELESLLRAKFPLDVIEPVAKGEFGGDAIQRVNSSAGQPCGSILWESKRTKNWSDGWLAKLRDDQRAAKADIAVLVTQALPKGVESFDLVDGIWVTHPRAVAPVALALRQTLIELSAARGAMVGQQSKTEMIYHYLTGPRFRQRVEAIVEAFSTMKEDLEKERRSILRQWARRDEQIERVMQATVGMYGDLQGIAGRSLAEIQGLEWPGLGPGEGGAGKEQPAG